MVHYLHEDLLLILLPMKEEHNVISEGDAWKERDMFMSY